ncbi:MAG TPA: AbrB/MazE/SpoVT family DNA-binding domain-containing protein [Polyangia bacterium]
MTVRIDALGRILVPKPLRDRLGLAPGTRLRVEERGGGLFLDVVQASDGLVERDGFLVATGEIDDPGTLPGAVERQRAARDRTVWG